MKTLLALILLTLSNSTFSASVTGIVNAVEEHFNIRSIQANLILFCFPLLAVLYLNMYTALRKFSTDLILLVAAILNVVSNLVAVVASKSFGLLLTSAIFSALCQPILMCSFTFVVILETSESNRGLWIGVLNTAVTIAYAAGYCASTLLITGPQTFVKFFPVLQIPLLVLDLIAALLLVMEYWKHKDEVSLDELLEIHSRLHNCPKPEITKQSRFERVRSIFVAAYHGSEMPWFILFWVLSCALSAGMNNAWGFVLPQILQDQGYTNTQVFNAGMWFLVFPSFVPLLVGCVFDQVGDLRKTFTCVLFPVFCTVCVSSTALLVFFGSELSVNGLFLTLAFYGLFSNAITTLQLTCALKITRDVSADSINSCLIWASNLVTLLYTITMSLINTTSILDWLYGIGCSIGVISMIVALFIVRRSFIN